MQRILITGGTGSLGSVVVPRLKQDYECILRCLSARKAAAVRLAAHVLPRLGRPRHTHSLPAAPRSACRLIPDHYTSRTWHDQRSLSAERRKSPE